MRNISILPHQCVLSRYEVVHSSVKARFKHNNECDLEFSEKLISSSNCEARLENVGVDLPLL